MSKLVRLRNTLRFEDVVIFFLLAALFIAGFIVPTSFLLAPVLVSVPILLVVLLLLYAKGELSVIKASISWVLLGVALLTFAVFDNQHISNQAFGTFLSNFATVFISLGLINIVLQLKDTKDYFANALSDLVTRETYIAKLSRAQLEVLQKRVLERYFENSTEFDRENSFYNFFNRDLQRYIGAPYRENYLNSITVEDSAPTNYRIRDQVSYTARAVGGRIQNEIRWSSAKNEIKEVISFRLLLDKAEVFSWPQNQAANPKPDASAVVNHNFGGAVEADGVFFEYQLKDFQKHEKLHVEFEAVYLASSYRSLTLKVIYPTFGFTVILNHPKELKSRIEPYGFDNRSVDFHASESSTGAMTSYKNWMLPHSGLYIDVQSGECVPCKNGMSLAVVN